MLPRLPLPIPPLMLTLGPLAPAPAPPLLPASGFGLGVLVLYLLPPLPCGVSAEGAGLPIGMNTFCRLPMVTGDWVACGDEPCPVGDENELLGVADRELLSDTVSRTDNENNKG